MSIKNIIFFVLITVLTSCGNRNTLLISKYYEYDMEIPLQDSVRLLTDTTAYKLYDVKYRSVHNKTVSARLTVPKNSDQPLPVIILLHGLGDEKTVDYIEFGNDYFHKKGYAVFRIDISNHGERIENKFDFDFTGEHRFWTRNVLSQTVFDLRRAIDFINSRKELDHNRIGFFGISLGGIIGTVFCSVDERVKVPVLVLAGGQINLMFGTKMLSTSTNDYLSIIEPMNFIKKISPRPLLMLNAENDEVIPPIMSKLLYGKAKKPKNIIWYPAKHHSIPIEEVYKEGADWFEKYLIK